jgi:Calcineurin-like phosphoesterase
VLRALGCLCAAIGLAFAAIAAGCGSDVPTKRGQAAAEALLARNSPAGERLTVGVAADFGIQAAGAATLKAMARANPDMYLALGDFGYAGPDSATKFCDLVHRETGPDAPVEIVSGNHEEDTGGDGRIDDFTACLPDRLGAHGAYGKQYSIDVGRLARFIIISPDLTIDRKYYFYASNKAGRDTPDLTWLKKTIDRARADGIQWILVGMHKNCISIGEYYCDVHQELFSTLIAKRVDLVLSGHDHTYQRSKQIGDRRPGCRQLPIDRFKPDCVIDSGDSYAKGAGSVFVISGAGGRPLYPVHRNDPEAGYFVTAMGGNTPGNRHGFSLVTISRRRLALRFVGSTPGTFSDRFEIVGGG